MLVYLRPLIYIMELKCLKTLNLRFLILFAEIANFLCILRSQFCTKKNTRFCKIWHVLNFNFTLNYKVQSRNPNILLMPYRGRIFVNGLNHRSEHI